MREVGKIGLLKARNVTYPIFQYILLVMVSHAGLGLLRIDEVSRASSLLWLMNHTQLNSITFSDITFSLSYHYRSPV